MRAGLGTLVAAAYLLSIAAEAAPSPTGVRSVETDATRLIKLSDGCDGIWRPIHWRDPSWGGWVRVWRCTPNG